MTAIREDDGKSFIACLGPAEWGRDRWQTRMEQAMLHSVTELEGYTVGASDGELGTVADVYFDDNHWVIRYLVVETGGWLSGRKVLISPNSVRSVTWGDEILNVNLSQQQVIDSPSIDTDKPVSRQHEIDHCNYYGYPYYWGGPNLWGNSMYPLPWVGASPDSALASREPRDDAVARERQARLDPERESADSHLRCVFRLKLNGVSDGS